MFFNVHDARNDVLPCWIVSTSCQPKWLRTRSAEIQYEEKYVDCWLFMLSCCKMNCEWDNVKNRSQTAEVRFLKTEPRKPSFRFLNFEFGSVRFLENGYPKFSSDSAHPYKVAVASTSNCQIYWMDDDAISNHSPKVRQGQSHQKPLQLRWLLGGVTVRASDLRSAVVGSIPGRAAIKLPSSTQPSIPSG